jgi:hypothetical protein
MRAYGLSSIDTRWLNRVVWDAGASARLWDTPVQPPDDGPELAACVGAASGFDLDERGALRVLDCSAWLVFCHRLERLGGPTPADPSSRLNPIPLRPSGHVFAPRE